MTKLSLDEPPPRFRGEKEVRKKSKNLLQLTLSTRNERNRDKSTIMKNLEKQIKKSMEKYYLEENYSSLERNFQGENQTPTLNNLEFSRNAISNSGMITQEFNYFEKKEDLTSARKKIKNIYGIDSSYSFTMSQFVKEIDNKENPYSKSRVDKKDEERDILYTLCAFEEEKKTDEKEIKFNVMAYNQ